MQKLRFCPDRRAHAVPAPGGQHRRSGLVWSATVASLLVSGCEGGSFVLLEGTVAFEGVPVLGGSAALTTGGPEIAYADLVDGYYSLPTMESLIFFIQSAQRRRR